VFSKASSDDFYDEGKKQQETRELKENHLNARRTPKKKKTWGGKIKARIK